MRKTALALPVCILMTIAVSTAFGEDPIYTDNVVIVLDGSGSMKDRMKAGNMSRMAAAKSALHQVLAQLPETTHVGVLVFSQNARNDWLAPLGPRQPEQLRQAIDALRPGGGTPLGKYIKIGADRLLEQRAKQLGYGTCRLLIVTDGEASDGDLVNRYTPEVVARGVTVDVIGVDMKRNHTLATKVHSYRRADDPKSLRRAIAEVFAEVGSSGTGDVAAEESFEVIAPLPAEVALAMIKALAASGNDPIGARKAAAARSGSSSSRAPRPSVATPSVDTSGGFFAKLMSGCFISVILLAIATGILVVILKKSRR